MAKTKSTIDSGLNLPPQPSDTTTQAGDLETQASGKIVLHNGTTSSPIVTAAHAETLTNKTIDGDTNTVQDLALTSLKTVLADADKLLQRDAAGIVVSGSVVPAGNLVTDSSTSTLTNKTIDGDDNTVQDLALTSLKTEAGDANNFIVRDVSGIVVGNTKTVPTGDVVGTSDTQALTNKTIDGDTNTVQDLALTSLKTNLTDATKFLVRDASGIVISNTKEVPTGVVVGDTDTQTLTNKTLTSPLITTGVVDDGVDLIEESSISSPSAGRRRLALKTDGKLYLRNSAGNEVVVGSGSSSGINYIGNSDAETDTSGWSLYDDGAVARPINGTGGSAAQLTLTRSTSSPLRGAAEFSLAKAAADAQGEGVAIDFTIDQADQAKMLSISFDYEIASGTYSGGSDSTDSDLIVYMFRTNITERTIEPTPFKISGAVVGQKYKFQSWFQTDSDATGYRLIIHCATTSASAFDFRFDNVVVGPQTLSFGAPVTESVPVVVTGTWSTNTTYVALERRIGGHAEYDVTVNLSGAPDAATLQINLPSGRVIDTARLSAVAVGNSYLGEGTALDTGSQSYDVVALYGSTTAVQINRAEVSGSNIITTNGVSNTTPFTFGNTDLVQVKFSVPILGWASSVVMSNDSDTRVVAFRAMEAVPTCADFTTGSDNIIFSSLGTYGFDTHGGYNSATGEYRVPVAGKYLVTASFGLNLTTALTNYQVTPYIRKNGAVVASGGKSWVTSASYTGALSCLCSTLLDCKSGDLISVAPVTNTNTGTAFFSSVQDNYLEVSRISGPSAIALTEKVLARYKTAAGAALTAATQVDFGTKEYDTHGSVTTGGSWAFVAPRSGFIHVSILLVLNGATANSISLYKNGSSGPALGFTQSTIGGGNGTIQGESTIEVVAGDIIDVRPGSTAASLVANSDQNYIEIRMD